MSQAGVASVHGVKPPVTVFGYVNVNFATYPTGTYTVQSTDNYISVDTNSYLGTAVTSVLITTPTSPQYRTIIIKDRTGQASAVPIKAQPASGNIDGQIYAILNSNYSSFQLLWNGTSTEIY